MQYISMWYLHALFRYSLSGSLSKLENDLEQTRKEKFLAAISVNSVAFLKDRFFKIDSFICNK